MQLSFTCRVAIFLDLQRHEERGTLPVPDVAAFDGPDTELLLHLVHRPLADVHAMEEVIDVLAGQLFHIREHVAQRRHH